MLKWNYRITKEKDESEEDGFAYSIRTVYYNKEGVADSWSEDPSHLASESRQTLKDVLNLMMKAFEKPVLLIEGDTITEIQDGE